MYGTRDAAQCFDAFAEESMQELGFRVGEFTPCVYYHPERNASCYRHGDDFVLLATRSDQAWFAAELTKKMLVKHTGTVGPCPRLGDTQEIRILNRILRYVQPPYASSTKAYLE